MECNISCLLPSAFVFERFCLLCVGFHGKDQQLRSTDTAEGDNENVCAFRCVHVCSSTVRTDINTRREIKRQVYEDCVSVCDQCVQGRVCAGSQI